MVTANSDHIPLSQRSDRLTGVEMRKFTKKIVSFLKKEDGPTAVEYAVMLAFIIIVCVAAISVLGKNTNQSFSKVAPAFQ